MREYSGILAIDERPETLKRRFEKARINNTDYNRKEWREIMLTTENLSDFISGVILHSETAEQKLEDGTSLIKHLRSEGIVPGIKVDNGTIPLEGSAPEKKTLGLDDLRVRLQEHRKAGLLFAKWRNAFTITNNLPSQRALDENLKDTAKFASICLSEGMVPIVEPELLREGSHGTLEAEEKLVEVLSKLFQELRNLNVPISNVILKTNMVTPGDRYFRKVEREEIAERTVNALCLSVPHEIGGVVFLSGGQSPTDASANLDAIIDASHDICTPFPMTFSFGRALQEEAMLAWLGQKKNIYKAKKTMYEVSKRNALASEGDWERFQGVYL